MTAPGSGLGAAIQWLGRTAVVPSGARLQASACLICGEVNRVSVVRKPHEDGHWLGLTRRKHEVGYSLCPRCSRRWDRVRTIHLGVVGIGLVALTVAGGLLGNRIIADATIPGTLTGFLVWLLSVTISLLVSSRYVVRSVNARNGVLSLCFPDVDLAQRLLTSATPSMPPPSPVE